MTEKIKLLTVRCPRCRKRTEWRDNPHRPFCSEKCRLIDLGRWAEGEYSIPGDKAREEESDEEY